MKTENWFILLFILLIQPAVIYGQKIYGGEMFTLYQGNDKYLVSLTLYTSCFDAVPGNALIKAKCLSSNITIASQTVSMPTGIEVSNVCTGQCTRCTKPTCSTIGIKKYTYTAIMDISSAASCCDIIFCYEQGTRTTLITTGPGGSDFYLESYLNRCIGNGDDISPMITPEFLAVKNVNYSHVLTCFNDSYLNDSLVYELTSPLKPGRIPVSYSGQYSYDKPVYFWGFPNKNLSYPRGLQLDLSSGQLNFRPVNAETALLAVKIKQFHQGQLYKTFTREWVLNISTQANNNSPVIQMNTNQKICSWSGSNLSISAADPDGDSVFFYHSYSVVNQNQTFPDKPSQTIFLNILKNVPENKLVPVVIRIRDNKCPVPGSATSVFFIATVTGVSATPVVADSGCGLYHYFISAIKGTYNQILWSGDEELTRHDSSFYYQYYSPATEYHYQLTLRNQNGCEFNASGKIKTGNYVRQMVFAGNDDTLCYGGSKIQLYGYPGGGYWTGNGVEKKDNDYYFNPNDNHIIPNNRNLIFYHILSSGECISTDTLKLFILETPHPDAGQYPVLCPNSSPVTLTGNPPDGKWYGTGIYQNKFNPSVGYGRYKIVYEVKTNNKCPNYDTTEIYVAPQPKVKFSALPPNGNIPLMVLFKDSTTIDTGSLKEYLWNFGDGQISTQKGDVSHLYDSAGEYSVILIVTSDKGCSSTKIETNIISAWKTNLKEEKPEKYFITRFGDTRVLQIENKSSNSLFNIEIISCDGRIIKTIRSDHLAGNFLVLDFYQKGIVLLKITDDTGYQLIKKIFFY